MVLIDYYHPIDNHHFDTFGVLVRIVKSGAIGNRQRAQAFAEEVAANYKVILKGNEPGLIANYHFDDGTGTTVKDASSAHHDAVFATDGGRPTPKCVDSTGLTLTCKQ